MVPGEVPYRWHWSEYTQVANEERFGFARHNGIVTFDREDLTNIDVVSYGHKTNVARSYSPNLAYVAEQYFEQGPKTTFYCCCAI